VAPWRARRLAKLTRSLSLEAARHVDQQLVDRLDSCGPVTIDRHVAAAKVRFEPEDLATAEEQAKANWDVKLFPGAPGDWAGTSSIDAVGDTLDLTKFHDVVCKFATELGEAGDTGTYEQRKAKALGVIADQLTGQANPRSKAPKLYLHINADDLDVDGAVGSVEKLGPATISKLRTWLTDSRVTIQPVLDRGRVDALDEHDPPPYMDDLVRLRDRHCVFPWCERDSRGCDLDHIDPYDPGTGDDPGPPGQTRPENLAPLCRRHHRCKTAGRWTYQRHRDGTYAWHSPHGRRYLVTPFGTTELH
jgi:hypothetical protein